jgi:hypothetical protein
MTQQPKFAICLPSEERLFTIAVSVKNGSYKAQKKTGPDRTGGVLSQKK